MKEFREEYSEQPYDEAYRIAYLLAGYVRHSLTEAEKDELDEWVVASDSNMRLFVELTDEKNILKSLEELDRLEVGQPWLKMEQRISSEGAVKSIGSERRAGVGWVYGVAASVLLLVGVFLVYKLFSPQKIKPGMSKTMAKDFNPGTNRATLTLSNGKVYDLRTEGREWLDTILSKQLELLNDGQLIYHPIGVDHENEFHTLATPRGGQFMVSLPDGSKVWLNAASSLRYPLSFSSKERVVELTGEGYFEVAASKEKPFIVKMGSGSLVQVIGTHFNINAYGEEKKIQVALYEGKLILHSGVTEILMSPGQAATVNKEGEIASQSADKLEDLEDLMAWKDGEFIFTDASIEDIMQQVARWYDVQVEYEAHPSHHFNGRFSRDMPLSKLLRYLELTKQVGFRLEMGKIIVIAPSR